MWRWFLYMINKTSAVSKAELVSLCLYFFTACIGELSFTTQPNRIPFNTVWVCGFWWICVSNFLFTIPLLLACMSSHVEVSGGQSAHLWVSLTVTHLRLKYNHLIFQLGKQNHGKPASGHRWTWALYFTG